MQNNKVLVKILHMISVVVKNLPHNCICCCCRHLHY